MLDAKQLAEKLNNRKYRFEMTMDEAIAAKAAGLVVVYGYSDDNMEFDGAIRDEVGCYDGGFAYITPKGLLENECNNEYCPYFEKLKEKAICIEAVWDDDGYAWTYKTDVPHETFDILDDGEKYCRGIVFSLLDIAAVKDAA